MTHKRILWVDSLKGLAIFLIYLGHFGDLMGKTYPYVFSFHVPLFFFLAGFFIKNSEKMTTKSFLWQQLQTLLLPYMVFCLLNMSWLVLKRPTDIPYMAHLFRQAFEGVRNQHYSITLWFLPALFLMKISYFGLNRFLKKPILVLFVVLLLTTLQSRIPVHAFFSFYYVIGNLPYFVLGRLLFPLLLKVNPLSSKSICLLVTSIVSNYWIFQHGLDSLTGFVSPSFAKTILTITITLSMFYAWISLAQLLARVSWLAHVGQATLYLCATETLNKQLLIKALTLFLTSFHLTAAWQGYILSLAAIVVGMYVTNPIYQRITSMVVTGSKKMQQRFRRSA